MNCKVYLACKMTGRDKAEMVKRAEYVCEALRREGLTPVSPVLEEHVENKEGKLINHDVDRLHGFWQRDKEIIIKEAHVILMDHAEMKSFGMEREYCLSRGVLWKPTVILVPPNTPLSVARFEDDAFYYSVHHAAQDIAKLWGTPLRRRVWRLKMLNRSLPRWIYRQMLQWR